MPDLDLTPVTPYQGLWPYHVDFDNVPVLQLINQIMLVNNAVERCEDILRSAIGTQGTLANRLDQSIDPDGNLKTFAIDQAQHNIGYHIDGLGPDSISYVRFQAVERAKLELIADEATSLTLQFDGPPISVISMISVVSVSPVIFDNQIVSIKNSSTVTWRLENNNRVYADLAFPASAAHRHYYDYTPAHQTPLSPDYQNYKTTSVSTAFLDGSLRIYINGTKLTATGSVYVPGPTPTSAYTLMTYTYDEDAGTFSLSTPITSSDVIRIDFDAGF